MHKEMNFSATAAAADDILLPLLPLICSLLNYYGISQWTDRPFATKDCDEECPLLNLSKQTHHVLYSMRRPQSVVI